MGSNKTLKIAFIIFLMLISLCFLYDFLFKSSLLEYAVDKESCDYDSLKKRMWYTEKTELPQLKCQSSHPMTTVSVSLFDGKCGGGPMWHDPTCSPCNISKELFTTKSECDKCPNRIFIPEHYPSGKCVLKQ